MRFKIVSAAALAASMALGLPSAASASTNLITNGGFEQSSYGPLWNTQFGSGWNGFGGQGVTGWTGGAGYQLYFHGGTETTIQAASAWNARSQYFHPSFNALSSNGGNFVALDGDNTLNGGAPATISQTLSGLEIGQIYTLNFDWAAGQLKEMSGDITEQLKVSFGDQTQFTDILSVASQGFSGWKTVTMNFTASSTEQMLTFLSIGTPTGLPPVAVLDGVSLYAATVPAAVPEPATWAMMLIGFGGLGASLRYRRRKLAAA